MKRLLSPACALLGLVGLAQGANEITVVITGTGGGRPATILFDAGEAITAANGLPTIESTDSRVNIFSTSTLANAGRVTFVANSRSTDLQVFLGSGSFPVAQSNLTSVAVDWAGLADPPSNLVGRVVLAGAISGDLTGSVKGEEVFRLEVGDEIQAAIEATGTGTAIEWLELASSTSSGTITASQGDIVWLEALSTTAPIAGAITAAGSIADLIAAGGIIITASPGISAEDGIVSIQAASITADIVANANSGDGDILALYVDGALSGSVQADTLIGDEVFQGLLVAGDLTAVLTFENVLGDILVDGSFVDDAALVVGSTLQGSVISQGDITSIHVLGNVTWSTRNSTPTTTVIKSTEGGIGSLIVNGSIVEDSCTFDCPAYDVEILSALGFGEIRCDFNVNALIAACNSEETVPIGDFECGTLAGGNVVCSTFQTFDVHDILAGDVTCDTLPDTSVLRVGGTLIGDIWSREAASLEGQIIVNAADGESEWTGKVIVGTSGSQITLWEDSSGEDVAPYYARLSADLGGGAVGLMPYALHDAECDPPNNEVLCSVGTRTWPSSPTTRQTLVLEGYGPFLDSLPSDAYLPVIVERQFRLAPPYSNWEDITDECEVLVAPDGHPRQVWVCLTPEDESTPVDFETFYAYRVTPRIVSAVTDLRSAGTLASPDPNIADFTYEVTLLCESRPSP